MSGRITRDTGVRAITHIVLAAVSLFMAMPFLYMITTSFKTVAESVKVPVVWMPEKWLWQNYADLFSAYDILHYYGNTVYVTVVTLAIQTVIVPVAAFAYARLNFRFKNMTFMFMLSMMMIPSHMLVLPRYLMIAKMGLVNSLWAVILVALPNVGGKFLLRQNFSGIPKELDESAMIDGCSYFGIYWRICLPLVKNGLLTITLLSFLFLWNDMLWPLIAVRSDKKFVLSVLIATMQGQYVRNLPMMCCMGCCATLPVIVLFLFVQKKMIDGISLSGMKM